MADIEIGPVQTITECTPILSVDKATYQTVSVTYYQRRTLWMRLKDCLLRRPSPTCGSYSVSFGTREDEGVVQIETRKG